VSHCVTVWGEACPVGVYQKSKSVWVATGGYMGQRIEVKGRSATSALGLWRSTATYRGNG
jgi:hypothetical protein